MSMHFSIQMTRVARVSMSEATPLRNGRCPSISSIKLHSPRTKHQSRLASTYQQLSSKTMGGNDSLRSEKEDKLINISKQYHDAIRNSDSNALSKLLAQKAVLYADKMTIRDNIVGSKNVVNYFQNFFDKYNFKRQQSYGAVDENEHVAFSIVTDKEVAPKNGNTKQPSNVISLTMLEIDSSNLISGLYILRQLPYDEAERRLKKIPDYSGTSFNAENLGNDTTKPSADRAKQHEKYATEWNNIFTTNDVGKAEEISDKNIKVHNLLTSDQTSGIEAWKDGLKNIFKDWEAKSNEHIVAVTPGNKAFIFWRTSGVYKDDWTSVFGLNILLFNDAGKISEVASIYQPFPGMREALFK